MEELRKEIDQIDQEMEKLFIRRMEIAKMIGRYKKDYHLPIENLEREEEILTNITAFHNEYKKEIRKFYECIFAISKKIQQEV